MRSVLLEPSADSRRFGRYLLKEQIGTGGMGAVFRAVDEQLGIELALKIAHPEVLRDETLARRFRREAEASRQIIHPNVVRIYDAGVSDAGEGFIAMELLEGRTLEEIIKHQPLIDRRRAARLAAQIAAGLGAVHRADFIHRDLKPANVMISEIDGRERAKLLDFGVVGLRDPGGERVTRPGHVVGTPLYMAPEQIWGGEVGPAADFYALGAMLYEMLRGAPPFGGASFAEVLRRKLVDPAPAAPEPGPLGEVVAKLLVREPRDRLNRAEDVIAAIEKAIGSSVPPETLATLASDAEPRTDRSLRPRVPVPLANEFPPGATPTPLLAYDPPPSHEIRAPSPLAPLAATPDERSTSARDTVPPPAMPPHTPLDRAFLRDTIPPFARTSSSDEHGPITELAPAIDVPSFVVGIDDDAIDEDGTIADEDEALRLDRAPTHEDEKPLLAPRVPQLSARTEVSEPRAESGETDEVILTEPAALSLAGMKTVPPPSQERAESDEITFPRRLAHGGVKPVHRGPTSARRAPARSRTPIAVVGAGLAAFLAGVVISLVGGRTEPPAVRAGGEPRPAPVAVAKSEAPTEDSRTESGEAPAAAAESDAPELAVARGLEALAASAERAAPDEVDDSERGAPEAAARVKSAGSSEAPRGARSDDRRAKPADARRADREPAAKRRPPPASPPAAPAPKASPATMARLEAALVTRGLDRQDLATLAPELAARLRQPRAQEAADELVAMIERQPPGFDLLERKLERARKVLLEQRNKLSPSRYRLLEERYQTLAHDLGRSAGSGGAASTAMALRITAFAEALRGQ